MFKGGSTNQWEMDSKGGGNWKQLQSQGLQAQQALDRKWGETEVASPRSQKKNEAG